MPAIKHSIWQRMHHFWRYPMSSHLIGIGRIVWAILVMISITVQWPLRTELYGPNGILPLDSASGMVTGVRTNSSLLPWFLSLFSSNTSVTAVCIAIIICSLLAALGIRTRITVFLTWLLLCVLHERNPLGLGGGDALLRYIGFILLIAPGLHAYSYDLYRRKQGRWFYTYHSQPLSEVWVWRLVLWQTVMLYVWSAYNKLTGTTWQNGTGVYEALLHPEYSRLPRALVHALEPLLYIINFTILFWELSFIVLLLPWQFFGSESQYHHTKRCLIAVGIIVHTLILLTMQVGIFSYSVFLLYILLMNQHDSDWLQGIQSALKQKKIHILYDGNCGLCQQSIRYLRLVDWCKKFVYIDIFDEPRRQIIAPDITIGTLDKAMHIRLSNGTFYTGFDAIRIMVRFVPLLFWLTPFLYIPPVPYLGRMIYSIIANRRKKCTHAGCAV